MTATFQHDMRVLGVDLGGRRIGLAISDPEASFAFPLDAIESRGTLRDVDALRALIVERGVERVVVGLPLHLDGRAGAGANAAQRFADALREAAGIPVDTLDERWTTREAERALQSSGGSKKSKRAARKGGERDSMAASIILRTWLAREASR